MPHTKTITWIVVAVLFTLLLILYLGPLSEPSPYDTDLTVPDALGDIGDPW